MATAGASLATTSALPSATRHAIMAGAKEKDAGTITQIYMEMGRCNMRAELATNIWSQVCREGIISESKVGRLASHARLSAFTCLEGLVLVCSVQMVMMKQKVSDWFASHNQTEHKQAELLTQVRNWMSEACQSGEAHTHRLDLVSILQLTIAPPFLRRCAQVPSWT
jgi:hypothetical protein